MDPRRKISSKKRQLNLVTVLKKKRKRRKDFF